MNYCTCLLWIGLLGGQLGTESQWKEQYDDSVKHYDRGDYYAADLSAKWAALYCRRFAATDPRRAETLIQFARTKWKLGQYASALKLLDDAKKYLATKLSSTPLLQARAWNLRAEVFTALGLTDEAKTLAKKARRVRLKLLGPKHIETLESKETLELLNFNDGFELLKLREVLFGKGHPKTAPGHLLIARIRAYFERAEKHIRIAMRLYQKINPEHGELAEASTQLGRHYRIREQYDEADQTLQHALKYWRELDAEHPCAAQALLELAMVRGHQGKAAEADQLLRDARERHFSSLSDDDLCKFFAKIQFTADFVWPDGAPRLYTVEAYLAEMLRRGGPVIEKSLRMQARKLTKMRVTRKRNEFVNVARSLEVLTTLRRLQKKSDPVTVEINGPLRFEAIFPFVPNISVALVNQDEKRTPVGYTMGGDYRGGRQERWRMEVRDSKGDYMPVVGFYSSTGGGLFGYGLLKPGKKWRTTLKVSSFVKLLPGDYKIRIQYHDSDEIAALDWLGGRIVCQSEEISLHLQPRVIDVTAKEKAFIRQLLDKLNTKGEIKVLGGSYGKYAHDFIAPDSPAGKLLAMGWKAVPQMIAESINDVTPPRQRAWMLALLYSITTYHPPSEEGVLPAYIWAEPGWSVRFGTDEAMSAGGMGWSDPSRVTEAKIVLSNQLEFARRWQAFCKYIVVRTVK